MPASFQKDCLIIARWDAESLKKKVESKFNNMGWFKCLKNKQGIYDLIVFGDPMDYDTWIDYVSKGDIFFDSGMYTGNPRPYSQWRANNSLWDKLEVSRHPQQNIF